MNWKNSDLVSKPLKVLWLSIGAFLAVVNFHCCDAQRFLDNYTPRSDSYPTFYLSNLAFIAIALCLSLLLTLGFALCRNYHLFCGRNRRDLELHANITNPNEHNFHDVILAFSGLDGRRAIPIPTVFSPFYQQDLNPPPPYHLAIHYPPVLHHAPTPTKLSNIKEINTDDELSETETETEFSRPRKNNKNSVLSTGFNATI